MSAVIRRDLAAGERLTVHDLAPGSDPDFVRMLGRTTRRALAAGSSLQPADVEPLELRAGTTVLRPLAAEDAEHVVRWRNRPEVAAELFSAQPPSRAEHDAWFAGLHSRSDRLEFVIVADGTPVGTIGLSQIDFVAHTAEYGILIGEDAARGRGIAGAASLLVIDFAFESLGIERLDLAVFSDNAPARRLYEKLGFAPREQWPAREKDGRMRPVEVMSLVRGARVG